MERPRLDNVAYFFYTGHEDVSKGVICVRVLPSVRVFRGRAFFRRKWLISVEIHNGVEVIEEEAFQDYRSLRKILIPPSVRAIKDWAFAWCPGLTAAILNNGLEEIGPWAFDECISLVRINIPPSVRAIKYRAFAWCPGLTAVILGAGLEEIWEWAFIGCAFVCIDIPPSIRVIKEGALWDCWGLATMILGDGLEEIGKWAFFGTSLVRIVIPPAVKMVDAKAFENCSDLTTITFCKDIEEFVSGELMRGWWNNGVQEKCLSTYCFFVRFDIPERLGLVQSTTWQTNIHGMLENIPSTSPKGLNVHFCSIDSKLSAYKDSTILEPSGNQKLRSKLMGSSMFFMLI